MRRYFVYDRKLGKTVEITRGASQAGHERKITKWPIQIDALGVNPEQVTEAREAYKKCGVPTDFTPDGQMVVTGPEHYKKVARAMNVDFR